MVTIALVGSLHLILIYAVLAALDVVPIPTIPPITDTTVIIKTAHPTPPPPINPTMAKPTTTNIPAPWIPIDHGAASGPTITGPTPDGGTMPLTPETYAAASAIAATHTIPSYPALDRRLDHEGTVLLTVAIDTNGNVSDASVTKSSGFEGLDAAAVAWVKEHWRYKPATRNGNAVAATARAEVTFRLTQN
jgi:protein TonB